MDKYDLPYIAKDMDNEMPKHTDDIVKIPRSYSPPPKNLMDESTKVNNKFLNNHQGEIEETYYKFKMDKNPFVAYQNKYYGNKDILNHDNFYHADLATGTPIGIDNHQHYPFIINPFRFAIAGGDDLETNDGSSGATGFGSIVSSQRVTGTVGELYNQISVYTPTSNSYMYLSVYDDSSDSPNNLDASTGSVAPFTDYSWKSVFAEWDLATTTTWVTMQPNIDGITQTRYVAGASNNRKYQTRAYSSPADPFGSTTDNLNAAQMKIGYS